MTPAAGAAVASARNAILRWPRADARNWLAAFLKRAQRDPNVAAVIAVGSAVRPGVDSDDLDLIVLSHDATLRRERAPIGVDLRSRELGGVDHEIARRGDLLIWAVRFGRPLLDKNDTWKEIVRRWEDRLPLPDPEVALARAEAIRGHLRYMREVGDRDAFDDLNVSYLSHLARAALAAAGIHPASRPELPGQLREVGDADLAARLEAALAKR